MHTLVMTGATGGIGRVAAAEILRSDPETHLVLLGRGASGRAALDELSVSGDRVTLVETDLADRARVLSAAEVVTGMLDRGDLPPLCGFAGNAGVQFVDAEHTTPDGHETTFAVNVLANHLLLRALAPRFAVPARIVITVSDTHFGDFRHTGGLVPAPRWTDPDVLARPGAFPAPATVTSGRTAYSTSKLAAIYLVHEWARRLPAGVPIVAYNPSLVGGTGLARAAGPADRFAIRWIVPLLSVTPLIDNVRTAGRRLAATIQGRTRAASGTYVNRTHVVPSSRESYDPSRERELWDALERMSTGE